MLREPDPDGVSAPYRLTFSGVDRAGSAYVFWFKVHAGREAPMLCAVAVLFSDLLLEVLSPTPFGARDEAHEKQRADRLNAVCLRFAVASVEARIRDGIIPSSPPKEERIEVVDADLPILRRLLEEKTCSYQIEESKELYCSAASKADETVRGSMGLRLLAPTTRQVCKGCALPDSDFVCSHLVHPEVTGIVTMGGPYQRMLASVECDLGRSEATDPSGCRAEGHACWERLMSRDSAMDLSSLRPFDLPEALDHLDAAWRLLFGRKKALLRLRGTREVAELASSCSSQEEFESRISALADVLKMMSIPDELLAAEERTIQRDHTLDRLLPAVREAGADEAALDRVGRAIDVLRAINAVRYSLQHVGARDRLPGALARLGVSYPPSGWGEAWDMIRLRAVEAARMIREELRGLVDEGS